MSPHHLLRSITSITLLIAHFTGAAVFETSTPRADDPIVFNRVPAAFEEMMTWAIDLFDQADMELPPLRINHHGDDTSACEGRPGVRRDGDGHSVIDLCTDDVGVPTRALVLHELAHAWIAGNVREADREAFQRLRGYEYWRNYDAAAWHENGTEQAAEIIAWGLFDQPMAMLRINQNSCDDLEAGYEVLTGAPPLNGYHDLCAA